MDEFKAIAASHKYTYGLSRDEMNLAEFPLTILSTRTAGSVKTLEFKDTIKGKNGETVERNWIITGADKFGLPTSSDDEVLLELMKLTVDDGFRDRKVYFTRYELLRILRWTTEGRSYQRLQKALDRLTGVKIKATNAFYDNASRCHSTRHFGIVDSYEINDGRNIAPKPSFFTWSEVIFNSFKVGFIKKLDLDFYLDLQSAVSKRLYRFLDKHFWYKSKVQMNLFMLAHEKVGISRNYRFASSLRQQLDPALAELKDKSFIAGFEYEGRGEDTLINIYAQSGKPRVSENKKGQVEVLPGPKASASSMTLRHRVEEALIDRGIKESQLERLLLSKGDEELQRILQIVSYFDRLRAAQSHLVSRSPVGFLYRAVENPLQFVLPTESHSGKGEAISRCQTSLNLGAGSNGREYVKGEGGGFPERPNKRHQESLGAQYLTQRRIEIQRIRREVEAELLKRITSEVENALVKVKRSISEQRFQEVVAHGVDEKLAELFALPSFEQWVTGRA